LKTLTPGEPERPCYYSKNGVKLTSGFYWVEYKNDGGTAFTICSIHVDENSACLHGSSTSSIERIIKSELKGEFIITERIEFSNSPLSDRNI
jgi:hypothetical protein